VIPTFHPGERVRAVISPNAAHVCAHCGVPLGIKVKGTIILGRVVDDTWGYTYCTTCNGRNRVGEGQYMIYDPQRMFVWCIPWTWITPIEDADA
jgi:hypothetical protein